MSSDRRQSKRFVRSLAERPWLLVLLLVAGHGVNGAIAVTASAAVPAKTIVTLISAFTKHARALPNDEIVDLARLARQAWGNKANREISRSTEPTE